MKKDNDEKISDDDKKTLDDAVETAKKVVAKEDASKDELEAAAKELNDKLMPIGAKMYEEAAAADSPEEGDAADKKSDEPIEGEVVDEDKKD
jgi:molecular chaperone DnaK